MRKKTDPLPSREEAIRETEKRLKILEKIRPVFEEFCEAMIVVGSVAYGKDYSVRKSSDIDILLYVNRKDIEKIKKCSLITMTPKYEEAIEYFIKGEVDHFSINTEKIEGVETQYHFWDKQTHFDAEAGDYVPKVYNVWKVSGEKNITGGIDLYGNFYQKEIKILKNCRYGVIHDFPAYLIIDNKVILKDVVNNLLSCPKIIFSRDGQVYKNIELLWDKVSREIVERNVEVDKNNLLRFIYGSWSFSEESKRKTKERFKKSLIKAGYPEDRL